MQTQQCKSLSRSCFRYVKHWDTTLFAFGVMATVNLAIGQVTPPVGVNLFVAISIKIKKGLEVTLQQISKAVMPMIAASVAVLLVVTYVPAVSTALPKALAKDGSYTGEQPI